MESIDIKRLDLKPGSLIKILSENWFINGKTGIMLDPNPIEGSSQCYVEIEGEKINIPIHDVFKADEV